MLETLQVNGWADIGKCQVCNGTAWKFIKVKQGRAFEAKLRVEIGRDGKIIRDLGTCNIYSRGRIEFHAQTFKDGTNNLQTILDANGLAEKKEEHKVD